MDVSFSVYCLSFNNHCIHKTKQPKNKLRPSKKSYNSVLTFNTGLAVTAFRTILPFFQQVYQT